MPGKASKVSAPAVEKKPGLGGTTFGGFSDTSLVSLGDPYEKKVPVPSRHLGAPEGQKKWIPVPPMKKGRGQDTYFDKETRRAFGGEKDPFFDPGRSQEEKKEREKAKAAGLKGAPAWKNSNPTKKMTGAGQIHGTFQDPAVSKASKPFPHPGGDNSKLPPEYYVLPRGQDSVPDRPETQAKNIMVVNCKKGGYGVSGPKIFFSTPDPIKDDEKRDTYDAQKEMDKKDAEANKAKMLAGAKPFKSASKVRNTFDEPLVSSTGMSKIYTNDKKLPEPKEKKKEDKKDDRKPFQYSSPPKSGEQGNLNKWTERGKIVNVYDQKRIDEKTQREKAPKNIGGKAWAPPSAPKVGCTRSLLQKTF